MGPNMAPTPKIAIPDVARAGRALAIYGEAGHGAAVARGKYEDGRFSDALVDASVALIERWGPEPAPEWVTCIPSHRHPELVPDVAGEGLSNGSSHPLAS